MKRFIKLSIIFIIPVCLILGITEYAARQVPNSYKYKYARLQELQDSLQILILGSSHAYMGLDPSCFTLNTFNAANVSQPLCIDDYLAHKFIPKSPKLRYVILPISYSTFFEELKDGEEWFREIAYTLYMDYPEYGVFTKQHYELSNFNTAIDKLKQHYIYHKDLIQLTPTGMSKMYYLNNRAKNDWDNGATRASLHLSKDFEGEIMRRNITYLGDIASLTHKMGIQLILVTTPVRASYLKNIDKKQLAKMYGIINTFCRKYNNIRYLDYFSDTLSYTDIDFYDSDHLSEYGAKKLSLKINAIISE
ncbi:MAG: hypothetical protein RSA66_06775 [Muribaculaceae bacterium]